MASFKQAPRPAIDFSRQKILSRITEASKKDNIVLDWVMCIYYSIWFEKNEVQALIDSSSEINAMTLAYALKLAF